jgi:hypothetical protein
VKSVSVAKINDELTAIGIDRPIFAYASPLEEFLLDPFVSASGALRQDLHDDCRSSLNVGLGQDAALIARDEYEIRLDHIVDGKYHVDRRQKDTADTRVTHEEIRDREIQPAHEVLVTQVWRRGHVVDPIDDFVPEPVPLREQQKVVVGESSIRVSCCNHRIAPVHVCILSSS